MGPTNGAKSVEMSIDRLIVVLVKATPLHVSNRRPCRARKEERGRVCVDSQRFSIHFTSLLVT
jgi:hypothetical protein